MIPAVGYQFVVEHSGHCVTGCGMSAIAKAGAIAAVVLVIFVWAALGGDDE